MKAKILAVEVELMRDADDVLYALGGSRGTARRPARNTPCIDG